MTPEAAEIDAITDLVRVADATGLDLVAIQDHAYNHTFLDTWTLIAFLAAKTQRIHFLPDVADLPLRPPAMLAKAAATLDQLTGGRAELGATVRCQSGSKRSRPGRPSSASIRSCSGQPMPRSGRFACSRRRLFLACLNS